MKFFLAKAIFYNRVPFDKLEVDFTENQIAVLSAVNGKGKTTILSHITDAFYELARPFFPQEFESKMNKLYRFSGDMFTLNPVDCSVVYLRFIIDTEYVDYIDVRGNLTKEKYEELVNINDKIPFDQFVNQLESSKYVKTQSNNLTREKVLELFNNNLLTYFPSYRYEQPGYLNDPYRINLTFHKTSGYDGYLNNPIEVVSDLPQLVNWILDVILDNQYLNITPEDLKTFLSIQEGMLDQISAESLSQFIPLVNHLCVLSKSELQRNLNLILTKTLVSKNLGQLRFGIGQRNFGATRIQIVKENGSPVYPSIFNISSGESAILCLFGELIKQADKIKKDVTLPNITGIVLVDEIDKHLHIRLQKEVLPILLNLFPNVQFIVSSHSPFLSMGLAEISQDRSTIIDLDNLGISTNPLSNELYNEVYQMMINENVRFKELYEVLEQKVKDGTKPLVITEGKTDIIHLEKALEKLNITEYDLEFHNAESDSKLKAMLEQICKINHQRKIIGIFDRDVPSVINEIEKDGQPYKNYGNNVYAFCIPKPNNRDAYVNISIEFYYTDEVLKSTKDGKCLYFDNELNFDSKRKPISPINNAEDNIEKKIWDENIGELTWIHSKARFAELIKTDIGFIKDINFENFRLIFDKIECILNTNCS